MSQIEIPNEIDYKQYTENPQEFFIIINNLINLTNKEYEYAQYLLEDMINYQTEKFSSENVKLCKFYNKYIDILLKKFFDNEYLTSLTNELNNDEILITFKYLDDIYDFCKEYLEKCIKIYSNYLEKYKNSNIIDLNSEIKDYFLELSEVYRNYAIIEKEERNFNTAIIFFDKSINLYLKYVYKENKYNKYLLSIFIEKSTCFINNPHYYLVCLYKIKCLIDILISFEIENYNLNENFILPEKNFLETEKINVNDKKLFFNNEFYNNEKFKKICEKNENLNDLMFYYENNNEKIKDDIEEIFVYEEFKKKYGEEFIKNEYNKDFFDSKINMNEIENINNNLIKRKKRFSMENDYELDKIKENVKNDSNKKKYI